MESEESRLRVLGPIGRLDSSSSPAFEAKVGRALEAGFLHLVFDLSALDYLSSAGLAVVLRTAQTLESRGGRLCLAAPRDQVSLILETAGYPRIMPVLPTVHEACKTCLGPIEQRAVASQMVRSPLNLPEQLFLLAFDEKRGRAEMLHECPVADVLAACGVIELALAGCLDWDQSVLRVSQPGSVGDPVLEPLLTALCQVTPAPIERALRFVFAGSSDTQRRIEHQLICKGILRDQPRKLAGIFDVHRHAIADEGAVEQIRERVRAVILEDQIPDAREAVLAGLAHTCGLLERLLPPDVYSLRRHRVSELWQLNVVGQTLSHLIREIDRLAKLSTMM